MLSGTALLLRHAPAGVLHAWQASSADDARAQIGGMAIETLKLTDRLKMLSGPGGNVIVFHGPDGKVVVDGFVKTAWPKLKVALAAIDESPLKWMIDTHWHFDHADNNGNLRAEGAAVVAHDNTRKRLMETHEVLGMQFPPVATADLPTKTFPVSLTLNVNGEQVSLRHVPPAHTDTDILVYFPKADVLHMGDLFFNGIYPFIDAGTGGNIDGMIAASGTALKMVTARTRIVPGHGPLATRGSLEAYRAMLSAMRDRIAAEKKAGKTLAEVKAAKPSASFDAAWGKGFMAPDDFVALVYNTLR